MPTLTCSYWIVKGVSMKSDSVFISIILLVILVVILIAMSMFNWMEARAMESCRELSGYRPIPEGCV